MNSEELKEKMKTFWDENKETIVAAGVAFAIGAVILSKLQGKTVNQRKNICLVHPTKQEQCKDRDQFLAEYEAAALGKRQMMMACEMIADYHNDETDRRMLPVIVPGRMPDGSTRQMIIGALMVDNNGSINNEADISEFLERALQGRFLSGNFHGAAIDLGNGFELNERSCRCHT